MLFQPIDDKTRCIGVYVDGNLIFDENEMPKNLTRTWCYTGSLKEKDVQYAWIYAGGKTIEEICPEHLEDAWGKVSKKMRAYRKSFDIAKCMRFLIFIITFLHNKNIFYFGNSKMIKIVITFSIF